jgi:flagellar assembly protein FliH
MMISPSKSAAPTRLLGEPLRGKDVARLEFYPVDWVAEEPTFVDEPSSEMNEVEEKKASADMRLEAQAIEVLRQLDAARRESRSEAREEWEDELDRRLAEERARVLRVCEEFARERSKYFADVEADVVRLALAIAARVLHREAKLDPLLLAGVVRVALEKVKDESATVLRVPVAEVEMWQGMALNGVTDVVGDERMNPSECVLETSVGKVELGVSAQLEEIEKGFFDLLQQRPS